MQASANTATMLRPSTSHLLDALQIKSSDAHAHVLVTSGESSRRDSKGEVKGNKSSWVQRLKPREDMVALEASKADKGRAFERLEVDVGNEQPDRVSKNVGSRPRPNEQVESSSIAKRHKRTEGNGEASSAIVQEKSLKSDVGRNSTAAAAILSTEMGFGPWLDLNFGKRSETEKTDAPSKNILDAAMNGRESCKEIEGNFHSPVIASVKGSLGISQEETITTLALCKPPVHSKLGLPPRPPCQKLACSLSTSKVTSSTSKVTPVAHDPGGGVFHQLAIENSPSGQTIMAPATLVVDVQDRELVKHGEAMLTKFGSFQNLKVMEGSRSDLSLHNRVSADCSLSPTRMENGGVSKKQQPGAVVFKRGNASVTLGKHLGNCFDVATGIILDDGIHEPGLTNVLSSTAGMDLQLKFVGSGTEKDGSMLQAASLELSNTTLQQSLTGGFHRGKMKVNEQVANASTSATLPWELFIETAGASKKAREQFVEVYNRARDELKNQRLLQSTSRTPGRELDGGPKLTLGPNDAMSDVRVECQSLQSKGTLQLQGKNTKLEYQSLLHPLSLKEKSGTTAAESSQCKQVERLRQVQVLSGKPLVVHEGSTEISVPRTGDGSVGHVKEWRTGGNEGPRNPVGGSEELISKLENGFKCTVLNLGPRESPKQLNCQEAVPVLGKRSRVTFEDHAMPLAAERSADARPRPQSKSHLWLQRWHSTPLCNSNGPSAVDTQVAPNGKKIDSVSYETLGLKKFRDGDAFRVFGQANAVAERVKGLEANSLVVPSAAAMAIVGTAARQFCSSQQQGKGSFAFWSGFGLSTYGKIEPVQEKGKEKVLFKVNKNLPSY